MKPGNQLYSKGMVLIPAEVITLLIDKFQQIYAASSIRKGLY
jgi:hypothetical protein